jgi:amidase
MLRPFNADQLGEKHMGSDFAFMDAVAQADLVRRKEVQPIELVEAAIERIEKLNPTLNAVVTRMYDQGRSDIVRIEPNAPLAGVPFLLKDVLAAYAGVPLTMGSELLSGYVPDRDSELVKRLKKAGLVILGKTSTPEFGILPTTEPRLFGPCHNPWNLKRTTGGSSGGSAAAVASGMVPLAHANDGGGSIRIPASCCGLFGLKPTRARNPLGPNFGDIMGGLLAEHAVTRSVRDSAVLLDLTAGPDIGDPYCAPPPTRPFWQEIGVDPGKLRICFSTEAGGGITVHPDCIQAVAEAAGLCADLGHTVMEGAPKADWNLVARMFMVLWSAGNAATLNILKPESHQVEPLTWTLYEMGKRVSASDYLQAVTVLQRISRGIARFFVDCDIWLTPTLAEPPVLLGAFDSPADDPLKGLRRSGQFAPFTAICNITGQPAMSVPLFWNSEGLPIGTHFIGRFGEEATLFRLASQLEAARPWADKIPPTSHIPLFR